MQEDRLLHGTCRPIHRFDPGARRGICRSQTRTNPSRTGSIESSPTMMWSPPREQECSRRWSWPAWTTASPPPPPRLVSSPLRQESLTRLPWPWVLVRSATCMGEPVARPRSSMPHFLHKARKQGTDLSDVLEALMRETLSRGRRIPGLGHRIHTADPRCDALWSVAEETGVAAECVQASKLASNIFSRVRETTPSDERGRRRSVRSLRTWACPRSSEPWSSSWAVSPGLSAHYFEEVNTFPAMRWINFEEAVYVRE